MYRRSLVSIGIGGTAVLVASIVGFGVVGEDFPSIFHVLPFALLAAIIAGIGTYLAFGPRSGRAIRSGLTGMAAFSYAFFSLWLVSYAIASTRAVLRFGSIALVSVVVATSVAALAWRVERTLE